MKISRNFYLIMAIVGWYDGAVAAFGTAAVSVSARARTANRIELQVEPSYVQGR